MKIFKLIYKIKENEKSIPIFSQKYIFFQARKCKMIINNQIFNLTKEYQIQVPNLKELKIKLLIFSEYNLNLKFMFLKSSLMKFSIISPHKNNSEKEEINNSRKYNNTFIEHDDNNLIYQADNLTSTNKNEEFSFIKYSFLKQYFHNHFYILSKENSNYYKEKEKIINKNNCLKHPLSSSELDNDDEKSFSFDVSSLSSLSESNINRNNYTNTNENLFKEFIYYCEYPRYLIKKGDISIYKLSYMFYGCSSLVSISDISQFDISKCKDISGIFELCTSLETLSDISNWDTHEVVNISRIFADCSKLQSLPDI